VRQAKFNLPLQRLRFAWWLVLVMAGLLILTACSDSATSTPAISPTSKVEGTITKTPVIGNTANPVTITWAFWGDQTEVQINDRMARQFEAQYPGVRVKIIYDSWNNYFDRVKKEWVGDNAPDVLFLDNIPTWAGQEGILTKLQPYIERDKLDTNDFYPGLLSLFRYNGSLYGLPRDNDTKVIYVNTDMFEQAGLKVPETGWTWQDLRAAALKLTQRDAQGNITRYGFAFEPGWWRLWVWQNGAELYDSFTPPQPPTKLLLNNKAASEAVQFYADLLNVDKVTPGYDQMSNSDTIATLFKTGKLAMAFGNHANIPVYAQTPGLRWDVVGLPAGKQRANVLGGAGYTIHKNSKHPEEAWAFVKWLTGPIGQALFADTGVVVSARKSVRESNLFLQVQPYNKQVFLQETEVGVPYPEFLLSHDVDSLMDEQLKPVWAGKATAAEVFAKLPGLVEPIFAMGRNIILKN
jgi:multiple sugar transport system substrate-binding protein